jgi:hypothetical protein
VKTPEELARSPETVGSDIADKYEDGDITGIDELAWTIATAIREARREAYQDAIQSAVHVRDAEHPQDRMMWWHVADRIRKLIEARAARALAEPDTKEGK